jgi:hypothetical protein
MNSDGVTGTAAASAVPAAPGPVSLVGRVVGFWQPVRVFTGVLVVIAGLMLGWLPRGGGLISPGWGLPALVMLAGLFAATEVFSVHLHFTRNSHSFSLFEIPLTLGLFFAAAPALLAAHVVASGLVLVFHRRQPLVKVVFNVAVFVISDWIAISISDMLVWLISCLAWSMRCCIRHW